MSDKELLKIWKNAGNQKKVGIHPPDLFNELRQEVIEMERQIRRRNRTEISVVLAIIPFFALIAYFIPFPISKIGAILVIPSSLFIIYMLKKVRQYKKEDYSMPLKSYLTRYKNYLEKEIHLLKKVAYWYLLPLFICLTLFFWGFSYSFFLILFNLILYGYINLLNQKAIQKDFIPLVKKLEEAIKEFNETGEQDSLQR